MYNCTDEVPEYLQELVDSFFNYEDALIERIEEEELDTLYDELMAEELRYYNHARQMGWE